MDRKSVIVLVLCLGLFIAWPALISRIFPPSPLPPGQTNQTASVTIFPTNGTAGISAASTNPPGIVTPRLPDSAPKTAEETLTLEDNQIRYVFTSHGGGIKLVELKRYPANVDCQRKTGDATNRLATLNTHAPNAALTLVGGPEVEGDGLFALSKIANGIRAEKDLPSGLRLVKEFQLSTNYILKTVIRVENPAAQPVIFPAHQLLIGTATPAGLQDETLYLGFEWYNGVNKPSPINDAWFSNRTLGCIPGQPRTLYTEGSSNVVWAAVFNQFFAVVATPAEPAPQIVGRRIALPAPTAAEIAGDSRAQRNPFGFEAALVYPGATLAPRQQIEHRLDVFTGPKEYKTLSRLPKNLDFVMNFGFWGFFAKALLLSMNGLYAFIPSYGAAIIIITVIIKLCFWPLTTASTRSMKRMAELQPQMKALQEKYKADPAKMNQKLMEFMKEHKVSPLGGCLPMLLQIPVFFGFYQMLQSAIELRGASFLWACDLSQADTIWVIPGLGFPVNPMPLLMGCTMLWQARLTPPSPGMDPMQQKIMKYMPMMFMVFLYNFSAGLTLYWTVQNLLTIAQMKVTRSKDPTASAKGAPAASKGMPPRKKPPAP